MRKRSKICLAAVLLAAAVLSSCSDISKPAVNAYTARSRRTTPVSTEEVPEESDEEAPEDDEQLEIAETEETSGFTTTGVQTDVPESSAATSRKKPETTFPVQTTPEEIIYVGPAEETTAGTTVHETTTSALPETAETTVPPETATAAPAPETAATSQAPAAPAAAQAISYNVIGQNGILVSYQDGHYRGIMACFGTYGMCDRYSAAVNKFAQKLPDTRVYSLEAPIASEFYTPQKFWDSGFTVSQYNKCERIREMLSGVTHVDAYSALAEHTDEPVYARTDHHWNPLGAYYAAEVFAKEAEVDFPDLSEYTPVSRSGYVGSMYTYSKDYHLYNDPETFTMYLSPNADRIRTDYYNSYYRNGWAGDLFTARNASSFYCSFIGSDDRITHITTDVKNGRNLVVFKMSYGNALIPFLTSGFENIYVCDMRYFDLNGVQFCKDVGATDLLFTDCVMMIAGNAGKYLEYILNL